MIRLKPGASINISGAEPLLVIDVSAEAGKFTLASRKINVSEISYDWRDFTIRFKVPLSPLCLEFRGLYPHPDALIQFRWVTVKRVSYDA